MSEPAPDPTVPPPPPPQARYRLTLVITGNTHEELANELLVQTRGGFLLDSDYYRRDVFNTYGGRVTSKLEHVNPGQTSERYEQELHEWAKNQGYVR